MTRILLLIAILVCGSVIPAASQTAYYRLVIERVECVKATADDILERDGKGDEVQVCCVSTVLNKKSNVNSAGSSMEVKTSYLYGDINTGLWRRPFNDGRIKAGDISTAGGIKDNTMFPYGDKFQRLAAPTGFALPLIAWNGFLQKGVDSVSIIPFLAEWDNPGEFTTDLMNAIGKIVQGAVTFDPDPLRIFGNYPVDYTRQANTSRSMVRQLNLPAAYAQDPRFYNSKAWFGDPHTRAIGMYKVDDGFQFMPKGLWINYETANLLADNDLFGLGKGKFMLDYKDDPAIGGGNYRLYLSFEKMNNGRFESDNGAFSAATYTMSNTGDHSRFTEVPGIYRIVNVNSGKVLDIRNGSTQAGDDVVQNMYNKASSQQWKIEQNSFGEYRFRNVRSNLYLDVSNQSQDNGAKVIQWQWQNFTERSNNNNQRWIIQPQGDGNNILFNLNSGKALEIKGELRNDGAEADQWDNNAGRHQQWKIEKL